MKESFDKYWVGITLGLLAPALFGYLYADQNGLFTLFRTWSQYPEACREALSKLFQLALFPDAALVFLFYTMDCWRLSRGLVIGLLPYILAALFLSL